eukprot:TRINITY_DN7635_c0_g5_i1.p1 TRINITY_DN7635_c0_g5~~TRINITY_DN7635_c0_g5_i1.p1  ORF type:complete len:391 (-),score=102.03 TRINITY_DN7635_c0_g5_i1:164-1306(-)
MDATGGSLASVGSGGAASAGGSFLQGIRAAPSTSPRPMSAAGLSGAATPQPTAAGRDLLDQVSVLKQSLRDLQQGYSEAWDNILELRKWAARTDASVGDLQEGMRSLSSVTEANRSEVARTSSCLERVRINLDTASLEIAGARDANKVTEATLTRVDSDLSATTSLATQLQHTVERLMDSGMAQIKDELRSNSLQISNLRADGGVFRDNLQQEREKMRELGDQFRMMGDRMNENATRAQILEQRLAETMTALSATRQNVEDLNLSTTRLYDDHERSKADNTELRNSLKRVHAHVRSQREALDNTGNLMKQMQNSVGAKNDGVDELRAQLQTLNDRHDRTHTTMSQLKKAMAEGSLPNVGEAGSRQSFLSKHAAIQGAWTR